MNLFSVPDLASAIAVAACAIQCSPAPFLSLTATTRLFVPLRSNDSLWEVIYRAVFHIDFRDELLVGDDPTTVPPRDRRAFNYCYYSYWRFVEQQPMVRLSHWFRRHFAGSNESWMAKCRRRWLYQLELREALRRGGLSFLPTSEVSASSYNLYDEVPWHYEQPMHYSHCAFTAERADLIKFKNEAEEKLRLLFLSLTTPLTLCVSLEKFHRTECYLPHLVEVGANAVPNASRGHKWKLFFNGPRHFFNIDDATGEIIVTATVDFRNGIYTRCVSDPCQFFLWGEQLTQLLKSDYPYFRAACFPEQLNVRPPVELTLAESVLEAKSAIDVRDWLVDETGDGTKTLEAVVDHLIATSEGFQERLHLPPIQEPVVKTAQLNLELEQDDGGLIDFF